MYNSYLRRSNEIRRTNGWCHSNRLILNYRDVSSSNRRLDILGATIINYALPDRRYGTWVGQRGITRQGRKMRSFPRGVLQNLMLAKRKAIFERTQKKQQEHRQNQSEFNVNRAPIVSLTKTSLQMTNGLFHFASMNWLQGQSPNPETALSLANMDA